MPPDAISEAPLPPPGAPGRALVPASTKVLGRAVTVRSIDGDGAVSPVAPTTTELLANLRVSEGFLATSCRSPHSRRAMTRALGAIAHELSGGHRSMHDFAWAAVDRSQVTRLYAALGNGVRDHPERAASANQMLTALRGVLHEAWRQNLRTREDVDRVLDGIDTFPRNAERRGRALELGEILQLFRSCAADRVATRAARDAALLALLYGRGLRRSEAAVVTVGSYARHPDLPETMALRVLGKGNKPRHVPIDGNVRPALEAWLRLRADWLHGTDEGPGDDAPLFTAIDKSGRVLGSSLSAHAIYRILKRRADRAGVGAFSPHDLRRTCISDLLDAGADIAAVAALAGHASVSTTQCYDRRGARAVVSAAARLHVPYARASA